MKKAYISCPLGVPMDKVYEVEKELQKHGYTVRYYKRGTSYDNSDLKAADTFVLMSRNNIFRYNI